MNHCHFALLYTLQVSTLLPYHVTVDDDFCTASCRVAWRCDFTGRVVSSHRPQLNPRHIFFKFRSMPFHTSNMSYGCDFWLPSQADYSRPQLKICTKRCTLDEFDFWVTSVTRFRPPAYYRRDYDRDYSWIRRICYTDWPWPSTDIWEHVPYNMLLI